MKQNTFPFAKVTEMGFYDTVEHLRTRPGDTIAVAHLIQIIDSMVIMNELRKTRETLAMYRGSNQRLSRRVGELHDSVGKLHDTLAKRVHN